jgi:cell division protein FtsB
VLALVVCAVVLSVAVPLRNYLAQRGALEDTVRQQERLREQVDGLEQRKAQLSDPAQVEVEARERLRYVRPGETPYIVPPPPNQQTPITPPSDVPSLDVPAPDAPRTDGAGVDGTGADGTGADEAGADGAGADEAGAGGEWHVELGESITGWSHR